MFVTATRQELEAIAETLRCNASAIASIERWANGALFVRYSGFRKGTWERCWRCRLVSGKLVAAKRQSNRAKVFAAIAQQLEAKGYTLSFGADESARQTNYRILAGDREVFKFSVRARARAAGAAFGSYRDAGPTAIKRLREIERELTAVA